MSDYQQTRIWQRTLAPQSGDDPYLKHREFLRVEFEDFRKNAAVLANEIHRVLPEYTVHDITHIDALWDTADLVIPEDMDINPAEAYVLGGAFLLHDLGMGLAAYPCGMDGVKKEQIWIDTALASIKKEKGRSVTIADLSLVTEQISHVATEKTLRSLHAKKAEQLAKMSWTIQNGQVIYLISNPELRIAFGTIIGLIAHSHWWKIDEIEDRLSNKRGVLSRFPNQWTVDPMKLACILRVADAIQIDDRRAPIFLQAIRDPSGISKQHWSFQSKLYRPYLDKQRLVFIAKEPFGKNDIDAWWQCHDTLKMIDRELHEVDVLLSTRSLRLNVNGVLGIDEFRSITDLITVEGWQPVDTRIRVNNVAHLVKCLGGAQLYGDEYDVPIREMIQNAGDAIRARRVLEGLGDEYGDIYIRYDEDTEGIYIEFVDNGIGMSKELLLGPFMDFGQSYWGTDLMHKELPGLESKGFCSTGKFGIGFFSLFMLGSHIKVTTNRINNAAKDTLVLEFLDGVDHRPILRDAEECEFIRNGGTIIKVWLTKEVASSLFNNNPQEDMAELIEEDYLSSDCNIHTICGGVSNLIVRANNWLKMDKDKFVNMLMAYDDQHGYRPYILTITLKDELEDHLRANLEVIKDDNGGIVGRVALAPINGSIAAYITVGGYFSSSEDGLFGVLLGDCTVASRYDADAFAVKTDYFVKWVEDQANKSAQTRSENFQYILSKSAIHHSNKCGQLKMAYIMGKYVDQQDLVRLIRESNNNEFYITVGYSPKNEFNNNVIVFPGQDMGKVKFRGGNDDITFELGDFYASLLTEALGAPVHIGMLVAKVNDWVTVGKTAQGKAVKRYACRLHKLSSK